LQGFSVLTTQEINVLLTFFHSRNVIVERSKLSDIISSVPSCEDRKLISVLEILNHAKFDIFAEIFPKFVESIYLFIIS
jgi:hypothetical protein